MGTLDGIRSIDDLTLDNQRVFIRADFDVPVSQGTVGNDAPLRAALPTVRRALEAGARVVMASDLGSPAGRPTPELSLEPVAARLSELLGAEIYLPDDCVGEAARKVVQDLRPGQICLLENLGFYPEEASNDEAFARKLAAFADVYINDAPTASRRFVASVSALPRLIHERAMGSWLASNLQAALRLAESPERPFVAIVGGSATRAKFSLLQALLGRCNTLCVGGVIGNTLLAARGNSMKASHLEADLLARGRTLLAEAAERRVELLLPVDVIVAPKERALSGYAALASEIPMGEAAFDVGPKTVSLFTARVAAARTVLAHGALGLFENPGFARGSLELLRALAEASAFSVVSGKANAALLTRSPDEVVSKLGFVSNAGSTSLDLIEGRKLPGVEALRGGAS
ncbi:MAG TPA: phosphoglycerate kinase [Polyangiaceae bacterium]|nr:phosphoglycerate kinase [Polyangiaceae bacterium]